MAHILTTTGPVAVPEITGTTLAHEHLVIDLRTPEDAHGQLVQEQEIIDELRLCREQWGLSLVVDLTCRGMGRDVMAVHRIAQAAGVHAVVATGYYYQRFHRPEVAEWDVETLAADLVQEIETGCEGSGIRPGVLGEIGSHGPTPTAAEERSLRAAALAAIETGLSVATHAQLGNGGLGQFELLRETGLAPHRISIGHQDLWPDRAQHNAIAEGGGYVAFDTFGKNSYRADGERIADLLAFIKAGYADRALLSNDISRDPYLRVNGGTGYGHVLREIATALRVAGVDDDTMDLLYRRNLTRFLSGSEL
ncbi:MAG: phosphotriesterase [Propioniciclava sp.]